MDVKTIQSTIATAAASLLLHEAVDRSGSNVVVFTPIGYYYVDSSWCNGSSKTLRLATCRLTEWIPRLAIRHYDTWDRLWECNLGINTHSLIWSKLKQKDQSGVGMMSQAEEVVILAVRKVNS